MNKKTIIVIFTGGTISMERNENTNMNQIIDNQNELINDISNEINNVVLETKLFSLKPSPSITPSDMFELAKLTNSLLEEPRVDGVVITHGTDTLEETAYFLDLYLASSKPVVFTGSMRSFSELGFDGLSNLVSSILVASNDQSKNKGVLVCLNDEVNTASEVTKSHTLSLDTFKSLEFGPIGIVEQENVIYTRKAPDFRKIIKPEIIEESVEIVKIAAGTSSLILNFLIESKVKGIVIEALGRGNVPPQMVPGIKNAIDHNIPVVLTSRCPKGRVLDNYGYIGGGHQLKTLGVIFTNNLNSQKARIRLMLTLGLTKNLKEIAAFF
jgi:L-asparaginase